MRYIVVLFLLLLNVTSVAQTLDPDMGIIPAPVSVKSAGGEFIYSNETRFITEVAEGNRALSFFLDYMHSKEFEIGKAKAKNREKAYANTIVLTEHGTENLPQDGYKLSITEKNITIAGKGAGLFYGIQTFIQLISQNNNYSLIIPCVEIEDYPRFPYRGLHLDVSRHFFSVEFVKKYIDLMAAYKLNNFHWHLTDDQGWRIEIKKYPKLTTVGSKRAQTRVGRYGPDSTGLFDSTPYGGSYTQEEIKEVVAYATARYINIVPEIEMPGHSIEMLAAYPELSCDPDKKYKVAETWGSFDDVLCPSETTFKFLEDVLTEVMELFPGKYIHIGGDECNKVAWKKSKYCQQFIKDNKLKDEEGLQSYFIRRMEQFVNSKGRSIIGWDEILEGGLAPNATIMSWRGEKGGIAAAQQNHHVIMTPGSGGLYFDHRQSKSDQEPLSIGGFAPLEKTYSYDPVPAALSLEQRKYIIGVQANVWTEYITTEQKVEYMLLPRMLALAEIAWTPVANKNYKDFSEVRIPQHLSRLDASGMDYRVPTAIGMNDSLLKGPEFNIELKAPVAGAKIYYTIDGYLPRETDLEYTKPLHLTVPAGKEMILQTIVITPSGKRSIVAKTVLSNK